MTESTKQATLATTFAEINDGAVERLHGCSDEEWQLMTAAEGWTVAATAYHLASNQQGFVGMVQLFAAGETFSPEIDMNQIHKSNAVEADENARADRSEVVEMLQSSGSAMIDLIHSFDDDGLDQFAGDFGGNEMTVGRFIEYVVIGHAREHGESLAATLAGSGAQVS